MEIFVKSLNGETITLLDAYTKVNDVKERIEEMEGIPTEYQRLIFEGKELEDDRELTYYKVIDKSTIHLSMKLDGGKAPPHLRYLAYSHILFKKICRKCYCRLPPSATRCRKAKCGRTSDIRPKKPMYRSDLGIMQRFKQYEPFW